MELQIRIYQRKKKCFLFYTAKSVQVLTIKNVALCLKRKKKTLLEQL